MKDKKTDMDKNMLRVLLSTVLGIVVSLACLVSTTWAWYSACVTSEGNVIKIGQWQTVEETTAPITEETVTEPTEETVDQTTEETVEETTENLQEGQ